MDFIMIIALVSLFIWNINQGDRIDQLEYLVKKLREGGLTPNKKTTPTASTKFKSLKIKTPTTKKNIPTNVSKPAKDFHLEDFLGKKFFAVLGVISIVLAIGFFTTWAFSHGLIGPKARIAIGMLFSLIILGIGEFMRPKYPHFFDKILAAGISGLLITTYLARNYNFEGLDHNILSSSQAFAAYAFEVTVGLILALRHNARFLGTFAIFTGIIIPLLVNSEPNPVGLFSYLSILAVAGFIISLYKKWPELLGILFLGTLGYGVGIYHLENIWTLISPTTYLVFIYGISFLLGSGGLIRTLRKKTVQTIDKLDKAGIFEVILLISAIFFANLLGYLVFQNQEWNYFGFFVLAQGFAFFFLADLVKTKKLPILHRIFLTATLTSIVFATIWEIGTNNELVLALLLVIESLFFSFAGKKTGEIMLSVFGKIAAILSLIWLFQITDFLSNSIASIATIIAFVYSINLTKKSPSFEKTWQFIVKITTSGIVLYWSFTTLNDFIGLDDRSSYLLFILPVIWGVLLSFASIKTKSEASNFSGLIFMCLLSVIGFSFINSTATIPNLISTIFLLTGIFTVLSSFFITDKKLQIGFESKKIAVIISLILATLLILVYAQNNLNEPLRTIFWIIWGGILFGLGNLNSWKNFRYFGIGMFLFLITKLYIHDVWGWSTMVRFTAFLGLGVSLLGISFIYNKQNDTKKNKK